MTLHAFLLAVVESLRTLMPGVDIQPHPGAFDLAERQRIGAVSPTIRVALMEVPTVEGRQYAALRCSFQATVLCKHSAPIPSLDRSLLLTHGLLTALHHGPIAADAASRPDQIRAANGYSPQLDAAQYALWTVTWQQVLQPNKNLGVDDLPAFLELVTRYDTEGEREDQNPEPSDSTKPPQ